jgi:hypothetical protein
VFATVLLYCIYIWNVYLDYYYIYGDCSPVRFLEVNKEMGGKKEKEKGRNMIACFTLSQVL